ncbi:hypothetical protein ACFXP3_21355 [Streptomyces sp. NPDC059096]|uniref:hypothetical protein n=1 Tax=Streptomyces sp. NPDC059096 TaxID=3346727 RepID=UPI0036A403E4
MSITSITSSAPVRPGAAADGVRDLVAETFTVYGEVQDLARLGVQVAVTIAPGTITADITVGREAAGLVPGLIRELDDSRITRTPGGAGIVGSMCQGNVAVRITVSSAHVSVADLEALVAAVDVGPDAATVYGTTARTERAA